MAESLYDDGAATVLLCGVGGQGTILAADLLAHAAAAAGNRVKLSEIHGMAQRGGSVSTVVRFGEQVQSMVCDEGSADYLLAFETTEALRNLAFLREGGHLLVNDAAIKPLPVLTAKAAMPHDARGRLAREHALIIDADTIARQAGSFRCANVVLLGALSRWMQIPDAIWEDCIREHVPPKTVEMNLAAFAEGRAAAEVN